ncbi:MFS general substrate transporter [Fistulina hepatica ATCC 64428]|uniref:MFS general substrate transporter n=1 Tax=Fistulina hepatica ATCC 64428 TaxID=1128425 RepID=A0A0D7AHW3_9AGAR|nr:MFS general substrate transporter [Fistulina hepatica ATCC 64428]
MTSTTDIPLKKADTESTPAVTSDAASPEEPDYPDGGLVAWSVAFGAFLLSMSTFGYLISWGTFQEYYELTLLRDRDSSDMYILTISAWIGSLQYALTFLPGLPAGRLCDLGYFRATLITSCAVLTFTNFIIAECKEYWQFVLAQGFLFGFSIGCIYGPCITVVSQWFKVKRPLAFGTVAIGACIGGIIYPIIFRQMVPEVGFKWTVRTIAFINFAALAVACMTMKTRLDPPSVLPKMFSLHAFASPLYTVYVFSALLAILGLYTPLTYISVGGVAIGINSNFAFYFVAIANAASILGRVGGGVLAVRYGPINVMIISMVLTSLFSYIWPYVTTEGSYIAIVVLYGMASGTFIGLFAAPVTRMGPAHDTGRRLGMQMTIMSFGALGGPPASGAIQDSNNSFKPVGIFAGTIILGSAVFMALARYIALRRFFGGKI